MNQKEALLFFPLKNEDEIEDLYEELLFEYKQFFITKFPIKKIFSAKQKKMLQMHDAYLLLGGKSSNLHLSDSSKKIDFSNAIRECFQNYQSERNSLKNNILKSSNCNEIRYFLDKLFLLQENYTLNWLKVTDLPDTEIQISNEPDPMSLLNAINEFNSKGGITFDDMNSKRNISPNLLLIEAKRLSLSTKI